MEPYEALPIRAYLRNNSYPGRGILVGCSADGASAVTAYFIMGRSKNSRNRVFQVEGGELFTKPFDASLVEDPSLILYPALRRWENCLILTNGDQTDTVYTGLQNAKSFTESLTSREFEPDAPNFTPRISAMLTFSGGSFTYEMSILKSADVAGSACSRYFFRYPALPGVGHLLHTYDRDGTPLPPFTGEPRRVTIPDSIDELTEETWESLDEDNKISLYVRYTALSDGKVTERLRNKNQECVR